ncbi:MAG: homocysteine S-methyltransferase family protein [Thermoanaerobaculia bacterium]
MEPFLDRIRRGPVVLGDGAWGTMLMARGLPTGEAPERICLERPELLAGIASLYLEAGAEVVTTNTFGANPARLSLHGLEERLEEICRAAVVAVRSAAGERAWVSGSIGPTGKLLAPLGDLDPASAREGFERQAAALAAAGADLLCVETMTDLAEAELAVRAAREAAPSLPVVATMSFEATKRGFFTVMGASPAKAAVRLAAAGADVVGANCGDGAAMVGIARELRASGPLPVAVRPNAGLPTVANGALTWPETPEAMAARVPELLAAGVALLGGCCGTTPEHVRALRAALAGPA